MNEDLRVPKEAKDSLDQLECQDHQEQKEAEVYLDRKENKEDQVLLEALVSLAELAYLA